MSRAKRKGRLLIIPAVAAVAVVAAVGASSVFAAGQRTAQPTDLLNGPIYGNIPNVTVRGVAAGKAPWIVSGRAVLTGGHLSASGKWLLIPKQGFMNTGAPIPKAFGGTTAGFTQVAAEITFANGPAVVTAPVKLSPKGVFTINANVKLPARHADPVVLIGPVSGGKMMAWFASTDFFANYGRANASMASGWGASGGASATKPYAKAGAKAGVTTTSSTGGKAGSSSGSSSSSSSKSSGW